MVVTYLVVPLNADQYQDVRTASDAEHEAVEQKLTGHVSKTGSEVKDGPAEQHPEQAKEVRQCQVEEEALRDGGSSQVSTQLDYHSDVSGDAEQAANCENHTGGHVPGIQAGGQRRSGGGGGAVGGEKGEGG